jgi:hypothetical protein
MLYDVFICHASEDKEEFVSLLANKLREMHVDVWYDDFALNVGDSLRQSIEKGLSKSNYGIVVLSHAFFGKRWPQTELNALFSREMSGNTQVILPIWHKINKEDVLSYFPLMADKKAILSNLGNDEVCRQIIKKIRPIESPLIAAQRELISYGVEPPPLTDEWWLDKVEASNRIAPWGAAIPEKSIWGRWAFPLPFEGEHGEKRGLRLAWTALQENWVNKADKEKITQISLPEKIFKYIEESPGLHEMCNTYPDVLADYAPQITIRGLGGQFESLFDELMCDDNNSLPLRMDNFGGQDIAQVACKFVQGEMFGASPKYYSTFEYFIWLLSSSSLWLPNSIRENLLKGMMNWGIWLTDYPEKYSGKLPYHVNKILDLKSSEQFRYSAKIKISLFNLIKDCSHELLINDAPEALLEKLISSRFIEGTIDANLKKSQQWKQNK